MAAHERSWTIYLAPALLVLAGLAAYGNSFTKSFHLDDSIWIEGSNQIQDLGAYLSVMSNRPVVAGTLYLNYCLHGRQVLGYHLVNVAIHIAAALTLFGLVRRTLLLPRWQGQFNETAVWFAFAVALIWLVHPLQTQAVTYIIQRCESLMGLAFLLTLYCLLRGTQSSHSWPWYVAAWCSCVLGAGSKEVMITILPVLLGYDRLFIAPWQEMVRRRGLFYVAMMLIWTIPLLIVMPARLPSQGPGIFNSPYPLVDCWMTQAWVVLHYLRLSLIPYPQYFYYRDWPITSSFADFWPAGAVVGLMLLATGWLLWRRHWLGFLGLWFFSILSLTSVIPLDPIFEHRMYLPLAAVAILVVSRGHQHLQTLPQPRQRFLLGSVCLGSVSMLLICLTVLRNEQYQCEDDLLPTLAEPYRSAFDLLVAILFLLAILKYARK